MDDALMRREVWLEQRMEGMGAARYCERRERGDDETSAGKLIIRNLLPATSAAIKGWVDEATSGRAGRDVGAAQFVRQFDPDDVAFITLRMLVSIVANSDHKVGWGAMLVARTLEANMNSETFKQQDQRAWLRLQKRIAGAKYPGRKHILWKDGVKRCGFKTVAWDNKTRMRVGTALLHIACEATGAFEIATTYSNGRSWNIVRATKATVEWLEGAHQAHSLLTPHYLPMVVPPKPWTNPYNGGYYKDSLRLKLVSSLRVRREYFTELQSAHMPNVYRAINALQATPWRINRRVYDVMKQAWESGSRLGGLPPTDDLPLPPCPWGDGEPESDMQVKEWKAKLARTHDANEKFFSRRFQMVRKLHIADEYRNDAAIYFPHTLDWRGRMYPVVDAVHPQADDSGRALIEFARGMPLGKEGAFWLAVHGANSYGYDKATFQERAEWVVEHQSEIIDSALRPLDGKRFWADADKPYLFLAWCMEWAKLVAHVTNGGVDEEFVSHIPVGMDGSCNGLQNFSAMLRDEVGGAATNLVPQERPADIYQRVADIATKRVEQDAASGDVNAVYWLGKVTRKLAKRPTMTLPYGSGQYGFRNQIIEELQKYKRDTGTALIHGDEHLCGMYLARVLYEALGSVVVKALEAMRWLREVSSEVGKTGLPVWWTAPSGMPVCQVYRKVVGQHVDFVVMGRRYRLNLALDTDEIDARKQAQGIAPNFVHSLDAAHMVATVAKCLDAGVADFAMVHDSYGTHAGNVEKLNVLLREAFVEQYSRPVLQEFVDSILSRADQAKLPPPPAAGVLDLGLVKASEYFFA